MLERMRMGSHGADVVDGSTLATTPDLTVGLEFTVDAADIALGAASTITFTQPTNTLTQDIEAVQALSLIHI